MSDLDPTPPPVDGLDNAAPDAEDLFLYSHDLKCLIDEGAADCVAFEAALKNLNEICEC